MPDPHIRMREIALPAPAADAQSFATIAAKLLVDDVAKGRVTYLALVTFVGAKARVWQIHHAEAGMADDIVRTIAREEGVDGLAFIHPIPVPAEVEADRVYAVAAECEAGKFDTLIALKGGTGLGGDMFRLYARVVRGAPLRWFGVEPVNDVDIWMEGIVGAVIKGGEA